MKNKLLILILWFAGLLGWKKPEPQIIEKEIQLSIPDNIQILLPEIMIWINQQEACNMGVSGEYKRHQVYSRAIKHYPDVDHFNLSMAIEIVIQRLRGKAWL